MLNIRKQNTVENQFKISVALNEKLHEHYRCAVTLKDFFNRFYYGNKFDIRQICLDAVENFDEEGNVYNMYYIYYVEDKKQDVVSSGTWVSEEDIPYANHLWENLSRRRNIIKAMNLYKR